MIFLLRTHAGLMILALCIMLTGAIIARFMKKKAWWLKVHRSLGITGAILILMALFAIAIQITLTERATFQGFPLLDRYRSIWICCSDTHIGDTPVQGTKHGCQVAEPPSLVRKDHLCLMFINILLGLSMLGFI